MSWLKAYASPRARRMMATAEGRRQLLKLCVERNHNGERPSESMQALLQHVENEGKPKK